MNNPLLELFYAVDGNIDYGNAALSAVRNRVRAWACRNYAWAIPTEEAIAEISRHAPIVEIGAGLGYWASLIRREVLDQNHSSYPDPIVCFDWGKQGKENNWGREFHRVIRVHGVTRSFDDALDPDGTVFSDYEMMQQGSYSLFACWPPRAEDSPMLKECLDLYRGSTLLYLAEWNGTNGFDPRLETEWNVEKIVQVPNWFGFRDALHVLKRR